MKRVLVISYFFPPCSLTASERVGSWAKHLNKFGYYPVIVTRKWEEKLKTLKDVSNKTSDGIEFVKFDSHEVHYLPYKGNLRDKIYQKYGEGKFSLLRKGLTFFELFFQYFFIKVIPYNNIYSFAKRLVQKQKIDLCVISGNPFNLFRFGYKLNKRFGLKWVADYRDAWSTSEINDHTSTVFAKIIHQLNTRFEKKWVSTSSAVTASSGPIGQSIEELTSVKNFPLYNGIAFEDFAAFDGLEKFPEFTITYVGTLYDGQKVEFFCEAFKKFIDSTPSVRARLLFPGLAFFGDQTSRIGKALKGYEEYFTCSDRIPREEILAIEKRSHLLFHVAWQGYQGIIASKIYEYIASGTRIIVAPSDHGAIDQIVRDSGCGQMISDSDELVSFLQQQYNDAVNEVIHTNDTSSPEVQQYSRINQVEQLSKVLDQI